MRCEICNRGDNVLRIGYAPAVEVNTGDFEILVQEPELYLLCVECARAEDKHLVAQRRAHFRWIAKHGDALQQP